jgi:predicted nucleic acid-binding protein
VVTALFDTNILIDHLRGIPAAATELARYDEQSISAITWMEVLVGAPPGSERTTRAFLDGFRLIGSDKAVAERTVVLRHARCLKLPDAIVWASAQAHDMLLVTRDTKGFPPDDPGVRVPYTV